MNSGHKLRARFLVQRGDADGPIGADGVQESSAVELLMQGRVGEAEAVYRKLIEEGSSSSDVYSHLAALCALSERKEEVVDLLNQALHLNPNSADIHCQLGLALKDQGDLSAAIAAFRIALAIRPIFPVALSSLANVLHQQGDLSAAIAAYREALSHTPDNPEVLYNLGNAQKDLGDHSSAIASYNRALFFRPADHQTLNNLGLALNAQGDQQRAISAYSKALSLNPSDSAAHWNLAHSYLLTGNYGEGWDAYEWRWESGQDAATFSSFPHPVWHQALRARRLLLWPEQGVGDQILFCSILGDARTLAPHLLVQADARLLPLLQRSLPGIDFYPSNPPPDDHLYDAHLPIGSLGKYFRRSLQDFQQERSCFLTADRQRSATLRSRLVADGELLCGIAWHSHNPKLGPEKSITLQRLATALGGQHFRLVSLQYGDVQGEIAAVQASTGVEVLQEASVDNFADLDGLASLIEACDLVISISNTTVHLAGALGKTTWLLLPRPADWRWGMEGETTPWYPSVRLFRQPERGNWEAVMRLVSHELEAVSATAAVGHSRQPQQG